MCTANGPVAGLIIDTFEGDTINAVPAGWASSAPAGDQVAVATFAGYTAPQVNNDHTSALMLITCHIGCFPCQVFA